MPALKVLGDHEATIEEANAEATEGDGSLEAGMELAVYNAAKKGDTDALSEYKERLHQILTPTKNTVLHVYIVCAAAKKSTPYTEARGSIVVEKMLEMCPPLLMQPNQNGDTALHIAARHGRIAIVNKLIQVSKKDLVEGGRVWLRIIGVMDKDGDTYLHEAVRFNHFEVVKILTTQGDYEENIHSVNVAGEIPLYLAAERGFRDLVLQIRRSCNYPAYQGPNGRTALHVAVIRNDKEMAEDLLRCVSALTKDEEGCTPLHLAASLGHTSMVELLLDYDRSAAYIRDKDKKWTPFHYAANRGHEDIMKQLISHCPDCCELVDNKSRNVLHCAIIAEKEMNIVDCVFEDPWVSSILLNGKDINGDTPLHRLADSSFRVTRLGSQSSDARIDKMAVNKANQTALDLLLQNQGNHFYSSAKVELGNRWRRNGAIPGCRIVKDQVVKTEENTGGKKLKIMKNTAKSRIPISWWLH